MGLREMLQNLAATQQLTAGAAEAAGRFRQNEDLRAFAAQAPELVQQGQLGQVAGQAAGLGQFGPLQSLISAQERKQAQGPTATLPQIKAAFKVAGAEIDDATAQQYVGRALSDVEQAAGLAQKSKQFNVSEARRMEGFDLQKSEKVQDQREAFNGIWNKQFNKIKEDEKQMKNAIESFKSGTASGDAVMFNFLARGLAGEKGPLSNDDINRFRSRVFGNDIAAFQNFITNKTASTLSKDQRAAFNELYSLARKNFDAYREDAFKGLLEDAYGTFPKLFAGAVDESIVQKAKRAGFSVSKDGDSVSFVKTGQPKNSAEGGKSVPEVQLPTWINSISDPAVKTQTIQRIQREGISDPARLEAARKKLMQAGYIKE